MKPPPEPPPDPIRSNHQDPGERSGAISEDTERTRWTWLRLGAGVLVLAVLASRVGAGPFVDGLRSTSLASVLLAVVVTGLTTLCCAWRWRAVAAALGAHLETWPAVGAVYRAQFLNVALPSGLLGDLDRALGHGRRLGRVGPAIRAVVWERAFGQVVQVALTLGILVALPSPLARRDVLVLTALVAVAVGVVVTLLPAVATDLAAIRREATARRSVVPASVGAVLGHVVVFLAAARSAGVTAPVHVVLPLAAIVLLGSAVPLNVAGWGPREGVAAWAFGAAGLGAGTGVTVAVAYGVIAAVATLPGALVLAAGRSPRQARPRVLEGAARD